MSSTTNLATSRKSSTDPLIDAFFHPKQLDFLNAAERHVYYIAGLQSGKTWAGAPWARLAATEYAPGEVGLITAPDYTRAAVAASHFTRWCAPYIRAWNGEHRYWSIISKTGELSTVYLRSMTAPRPLGEPGESAAGITAAWLWADEACLYPAIAHRHLNSRIAVKKAEGMGWKRVTSTPRGHEEIHAEAVSQAEDGFTKLITSSCLDNPFYDRADFERAKRRFGEDSSWFRQNYLGLFEAFEGMAFPKFSRSLHTEAIGANPWPAYGAWDKGWTAPTVYVWAQVSSDDQIILRGCKAWTETERLTILPQIDKLMPVETHWIPTDMTFGDRQAGDPGWQKDMRARSWQTRSKSTSRVSETTRLNLLRTFLLQERIVIDKNGEGAEMIAQAFELAELKPGRDILRDKHPHTDVIDAVGQLVAGLFGQTQISIEVH